MNFCMIFFTCCLSLQEGLFGTRSGTVKAFGDLKFEELSINLNSAPKISSTPAAFLDDNLSVALSHLDMTGSRKRRRPSEILLEDGSSSSSREELGHSMEGPFARRKKKNEPLIITGAERLVWECSTKYSKAIRDWRDQFLQLRQLSARQKVIFDQRIKDASRCLGTLFEHRAYELRGNHYPYQFEKNGELLPTDLSRIIDGKWQEDSLRAVADISKTWKDFNPNHRLSDEATRIIKRGSDLIIDCFSDMERLGVVTKERLSHFLNTNDRGELISTYVVSSYPAFSLDTVYLNFNTRLSLQESLATSRMAALVDATTALKESTWERIEFTYLADRITHFLSFTEPEDEFVSVKDWFLEVASPDRNPRPQATELEAFLEFLITHIRFGSLEIRMRNKTSKLIGFKILLRYIELATMHYHSSLISTKFWKGIKSSILFQRIRTFEESVGLVSSGLYSVHVLRGALLPTTLSEAGSHLFTNLLDKTNQLVDSNQNRQVSSFAKFDASIDQHILDEESLSIVDRFAKLFEKTIQSSVVKLVEVTNRSGKKEPISNSLKKKSTDDLLEECD
ncbi:hypothetical protein Pst134EA_031582 [Puccinia striiformis f. sp. tritici]|uniref:uncharacterized protein n=1 Tax=Puccinia striiformis f. sp. tritici TaxID=168172 RepID=UPI0020071FCF|nr:uncharacterized protein Pst134EA_031582 [Puccinia striiformis f. sp. tritici]KAH9442734.1 hypothetical protein Pst134EA_031582 [Puccinia striiformis f. sp. tritici]